MSASGSGPNRRKRWGAEHPTASPCGPRRKRIRRIRSSSAHQSRLVGRPDVSLRRFPLCLCDLVCCWCRCCHCLQTIEEEVEVLLETLALLSIRRASREGSGRGESAQQCAARNCYCSRACLKGGPRQLESSMQDLSISELGRQLDGSCIATPAWVMPPPKNARSTAFVLFGASSLSSLLQPSSGAKLVLYILCLDVSGLTQLPRHQNHWDEGRGGWVSESVGSINVYSRRLSVDELPITDAKQTEALGVLVEFYRELPSLREAIIAPTSHWLRWRVSKALGEAPRSASPRRAQQILCMDVSFAQALLRPACAWLLEFLQILVGVLESFHHDSRSRSLALARGARRRSIRRPWDSAQT